MENPIKNICNVKRLENQIESKKNKQFRELPISETERLRLKNSDATPLPVPVMMSHIT